MHLTKHIKKFIVLFPLLLVLPSLIPTIMADTKEVPVGEVAPNFDIVDVYSNVSSQLSDYLGKVVLIDLFATWCGPCIAAIPDIIRIKNSYNMTDLEIISIDVDSSESYQQVISFAEENNMAWIVSLDESNMRFDYGTGAIPTMYIINQTGHVVFREIGFNYHNIITTLDQLIQPDSVAPEIYSPVITPLTPVLTFVDNLINIQTTNITDDFGVYKIFVNVSNSEKINVYNLYPIKQGITGKINVNIAIDPILLFGTSTVEVSISAQDFRGNSQISNSVLLDVELVSEDLTPPQISNVVIQSYKLPAQPSKKLYSIGVTITDDTYVVEVTMVLKEQGKPMGYIINNITRSDENIDQFTGSIILSEDAFLNETRLYVDITATDVVGKTTIYTSLSTTDVDVESSSNVSSGNKLIFVILSLVGISLVMNRRKY